MKHPSDTAETTPKPPGKTKTKMADSPVNGAVIEPARALKSVCVYCGSGVGQNPIYAETARILGRALAENGVALVYGGGGLGLMGEVARSALEAGGKVTGIIPEFLTAREHMLREVTDLVVTSDMHQRKKLMYERSDAFVALPGGIGTLEELVEQLTWSQLGQHRKPIVLANIAEFWSPFLKLLDHMRQEAFIRPGLEVRFGVVTDAHRIVPQVQELFTQSLGEAKPSTLIKF